MRPNLDLSSMSPDQRCKEVAAHLAAGLRRLRDRHNKTWLVKRNAWCLPIRAEGGLSDRARQRALDLADDADPRLRPPATCSRGRP